MARMASKHLSDSLKQTFVVDNKVGAGGAIAATFVAQAAPDGYTLLFGAAPQIAVVPKIQPVRYDPHKDLVPVSVFGTGPFILAVNAATPVKTMQDYVAWAKGRRTNYGSGGTGSMGIYPAPCSSHARELKRCMCRSRAARRRWRLCLASKSICISATRPSLFPRRR